MLAERIAEAPLGRNGHLTELGANQLLLGELEDSPAVRIHVASCLVCRRYLDEIKEDGGAPPHVLARVIASRKAGESARSLARRRVGLSAPRRIGKSTMLAVSGWLAAACCVLLLVLQREAPPPDVVVMKGTGLSLTVFAERAGHARAVSSGDRVRAGDRLGFRVRTDQAGHLLIFGSDDHGNTYLAFPGTGNGSALVEAAPQGMELAEAVRLDDLPGSERLVALHCRAPLSLDDARRGTVRPDCTRQEVLLHKESP